MSVRAVDILLIDRNLNTPLFDPTGRGGGGYSIPVVYFSPLKTEFIPNNI
jgi:hypothetical protein